MNKKELMIYGSGDDLVEVDGYYNGDCFLRKTECSDEDADIYSDIVYMKDGVKWILASPYWEKVK